MKIRKTIVCGIMAAQLMGTTITAQGMEMPDLSACTDDEVIALLDNVQNEIADRKIERTASLEKGKYIGGKDIPAGDYVLRKEPHHIMIEHTRLGLEQMHLRLPKASNCNTIRNVMVDLPQFLINDFFKYL